MLSFTEMLAQGTRTLRERKARQGKKLAYTLFYSNDQTRFAGKVDGYTVKQLIKEFDAKYSGFNFALIVRKSDEKMIYVFNRNESNKFGSMTKRKRKNQVSK
jgi:hypothetical protein